MPSSLIYALSVECEGLVARVMLNGVDVFAEWEGAQRLTQTKVNPFIIEGSNHLEVALTPMTDDDGVALPLDHLFRLSLVRGEHGTVPGDEGRIARFEWSEATLPVEPGTLTGVWGRQFTVTPEMAFGPWQWQTAPVATTEGAQLVALVEEVHRALVARDLNALLTLTLLRDEELSRALDIPGTEYRQDQIEYWQEWFASPAWQMEPFDPTALAAVPQARGRLVRVTDPYGGPPLQGSDGTRRFGFSMMACLVDGRWAIAR